MPIALIIIIILFFVIPMGIFLSYYGVKLSKKHNVFGVVLLSLVFPIIGTIVGILLYQDSGCKKIIIVDANRCHHSDKLKKHV